VQVIASLYSAQVIVVTQINCGGRAECASTTSDITAINAARRVGQSQKLTG